MRRCSRSSKRLGSSGSLGQLKLVPISRHLSKSVTTWKSQYPISQIQVGHVFEIKKSFMVDGETLCCGAIGRVSCVSPEGYAEVVFDCNEIPVHVPAKYFLNLDVCVVTHEIAMVNTRGRPTGFCLKCILVREHGDGFSDVICQDGQVARQVHVGFLRHLPEVDYTDKGYLANAAPCRPAGQLAPKDLFSLKLEELHDSQRGLNSGSSHILPPPGYIRGASPRSLAAEPVVESRNAAQETDEGDEAGTGLSSGREFNICPFMAISEKGLHCFVDTCSFTSQDCVYDIGCGTGLIIHRILSAFPCRGVGVEINCTLARKAEQTLQRFGERARILVDDIRHVDLSEATAVVSYFLPHSFHFIKDHMLKTLRPGCVVLNYTYPVPGWTQSHPPTNGVHRYVIGKHLLGMTASSKSR